MQTAKVNMNRHLLSANVMLLMSGFTAATSMASGILGRIKPEPELPYGCFDALILPSH
jgi:hypothetical protein